MSQNAITLKLTAEQEEKLYQTFSESSSLKTPPYAKWQLRPENCIITCYESGKTLFQGKDAQIYASPFLSSHSADLRKALPQAGSDEVGTGDYFGPVVVAAVLLTENEHRLIESLHVGDSKGMTDAKIRETAPELMRQCIHTKLILSNEKYNQIHQSDNMNAIKAKMHNQAYLNLKRKHPLPALCVVDQFAHEAAYYRYLKDTPEVVKRLHFETKAEDKYPSVGAASIIARYTFLEVMRKMDEHYDFHFPLGGGAEVDKSAAEFVRRYGKEELFKTAKVHYANTSRILL